MAKGSLRVNGIIVDTDGEIKASTGDSIVIREDDGSAVITVDTDGKVGINTTAPGAQFDIRGPAGTGTAPAGVLRLSTAETSVVDADQLGRVEFIAPLEAGGTDAILVAASIYAEADDTFSASENNTELVFATASSEVANEKMRLTSDGKLGIGTAAPDSKIHIQGTGQQVITIESDDHNAMLTLDWDGTDEGIILFKEGGTEKGRIWMDGTAEGMRFKTAGTERLTILADGKVGIGTTAPANRFHVEETTDADLVVKLVGYEARAAILELWADQGDEDADKQRIKADPAGALLFDSYGSGSWVSHMTILWGGNVGIGTTAPAGSLHVHSASAGSVTAVASADELVVEGSAHTGISILSGASHSATLAFGDAGDNDIGQVGV